MKFWIVYLKRYLASLIGAQASRLRIMYLRRVHGAQVSYHAYLMRGSIFSGASGLDLGDYAHVESGCEFIGNVKLGKHARVGRGCRFISQTHEYQNATAVPFGSDSFDKGIRVDECAWIGSGVTILSGVTIGAGAIVAAGSVVAQSVPPHMVALGNPARVIYRRNVEQFERLRQERKYYASLSPKPLINPLSLWAQFRRIERALTMYREFKWQPGPVESGTLPTTPFAMHQYASTHPNLVFANFGAGYVLAPAGQMQASLQLLREGSLEFADISNALKKPHARLQ